MTQFHSNLCVINMLPERKCIKKEFLKHEGTSLSKWAQDPNHLYIHRNLSFHLKKKGVSDSIWYKNIKELQEFANDEEICLFTAYERCIRETPQLWNSLDNLEDKILGCWCKPSQPCRADVLIKLFNEKKAINDITQEFGIQIGKYEKNESCVDLTADE